MGNNGQRDISGQHDQAAYFYALLRSARASAYQDAEGYQGLLFAVEKLGSWLLAQVADMGRYAGPLSILADTSPLAQEIPDRLPGFHMCFADLYEWVRLNRNDALHQGAVARNLTANTVKLAITLEDALKVELDTVRHYMVHEIVCAELWQPISILRQQMLANAFTHVPVWHGAGQAAWHFVSDYAIARYLGLTQADRKKRLASTLQEAICTSPDILSEAGLCHPETSIRAAVEAMAGKPLLVVDEMSPDRLLGIITPSDVM